MCVNGDTLLVLDNREYQIKVKEAEAALLDAHGSQEVLHSGIETAIQISPCRMPTLPKQKRNSGN